MLRTLWLGALSAVIIGSLLPASSPPVRMLAWLHFSDKMLHFGAYWLLAVLPAVHESRRALGLIVPMLLALAALLEILQPYAGGRYAEMLDMFAGAFGATAGLVCGLWLRRLRAART